MFANLSVRFRECCNQQLDSGIPKSGFADKTDIGFRDLNVSFEASEARLCKSDMDRGLVDAFTDGFFGKTSHLIVHEQQRSFLKACD